MDGITAGGAIADDAQVVSLAAAKVWAAGGQVPGCIIEIEECKA